MVMTAVDPPEPMALQGQEGPEEAGGETQAAGAVDTQHQDTLLDVATRPATKPAKQTRKDKTQKKGKKKLGGGQLRLAFAKRNAGKRGAKVHKDEAEITSEVQKDETKITSEVQQAGGKTGGTNELPKGACPIVAPGLVLSQPTCKRCKLPVDLDKCQATGKNLNVWKCNKCNTKYTQLIKIFGGWPPAEWSGISPLEEEKFWKSDVTGKAAVEDQVKATLETLTKTRTESNITAVGGEYQPLSWYKRQGYDTSRIENNCKDTSEHPILGPCYRVAITGSHEKTDESTSRATVLSKTEDKRPCGSKKESDDLPASGSSSSPSSSTSSPVKKKKKHKKDKKDKKDKKQKKDPKDKKDTAEDLVRRAALEKKEAAALERLELGRSQKVKQSCSRAIAKMAPLLYSLDADLKEQFITHVPKFAIAQAQDSLKKLTAMTKEAKDKSREARPKALSVDSEELNSSCSTAHARAALLANFLATARSHCNKTREAA
jgi:hypothetical protein